MIVFWKIIWVVGLVTIFSFATDSTEYTYNDFNNNFNIKQLCKENITLFNVNPLYTLRLNGTTRSCNIRLSAPDKYQLGIACYKEANDTCRYKLTNAGPGQNQSIVQKCNKTKHEFPKLFSKDLLLSVVGVKKSCHLYFTITAVTRDFEICEGKVFPCIWIRNSTERKELPLCVPRKLACDGVVNCPNTGYDELDILCANSVSINNASVSFHPDSNQVMLDNIYDSYIKTNPIDET